MLCHFLQFHSILKISNRNKSIIFFVCFCICFAQVNLFTLWDEIELKIIFGKCWNHGQRISWIQGYIHCARQDTQPIRNQCVMIAWNQSLLFSIIKLWHFKNDKCSQSYIQRREKKIIIKTLFIVFIWNEKSQYMCSRRLLDYYLLMESTIKCMRPCIKTPDQIEKKTY